MALPFKTHAPRPRRAAIAVALGLAGGFGLCSPTFAGGLFEGMAGAWRGEGSIAWTTGETERLRCTAKYQVQRDGNRIVQNLTCATDSTRLVVKARSPSIPRPGRSPADGPRRATASTDTSPALPGPGAVKALVKSTDNRFNARVNVVTNGDEQTVSIRPHGIDVTSVEVTLTRPPES